jgi:ABC-type antimicrobial peptide transport system permease subunit
LIPSTLCVLSSPVEPFRKSSTIALRSLRRNPLQTWLTIIGMMIGVGTVLAMIAIGSGAQRSIIGQVRAAGMNIIVVKSGNYRMPQQWTDQGGGEDPAGGNAPANNPDQELSRRGENMGGLGAATTLGLADASAIGQLRGVEVVSGGVHDNVMLTAGNVAWLTQMRGEQSSVPEIRRAWILTHGRFFAADEDTRQEAVAVLGSVASRHLFGDRSPVGESIMIHGTPFRVIGIVASASWMVPSNDGDGQFDAVYIPVRTAQKILGRGYLDTVTVATVSTGEVARVTKLISATLRRRHGLPDVVPDDFTVVSQARTAIAGGGMRTDVSRAMMGNAAILDEVTLEQLGKTLEHASRTMAVLLASIAAVSLLVGGIGIMNIMLLSVTQRTREIGIRRAVGAQSADVLQQFLLEAVFLSVGGGLLGILLGAGAALLVTRLARWSTDLSPLSIAVSFGISVAIGIVFGYYPARQASRVTPMTALRYE